MKSNTMSWREGDTSGGYSGDDNYVVKKTTHHQHHQHPGNQHTAHHRQDDDVRYKMVPPDGGWGWVVALGTFLIAVTLPVLGPCFGVLFSGYLLESGSSSTMTAWIFNLQSFLWFSSAPFTRPLTQEFGWRPVALIGSITGCVGMTISAFTPKPTFLFFSFSLLTGLGGGVVTCQCFTILPYYFERLRGLTNAFLMSGIGVGQFVAPPVARYLQDQYGFRGATLILSGILFHSCIGALFFHPYEWHQKKVLIEKDPKEQDLFTNAKDKASPHPSRDLLQSSSVSSFVRNTREEEYDGSLTPRVRLLGRLESLRTSISSSRQSSRHGSALSLSSMDMGSAAIMSLDDEQDNQNREIQSPQEGCLPIRILKSTLKDIVVLRYLRACIFCFGACLAVNGLLNFIMMVPFAMINAGLSKDTAAWCVSVSAVCNLAARILVSVLSDFQWFKKRLIYLCGFVLAGSGITAFTYLSTAEALMAVMVVYGTGVGTCMGLSNLIIIDVMGVDRLPTVYATSSCCISIGFICIGPFIGFIRDATQSYAISMRLTAGMYALAVVAWTFMGVAERYDLRRESAEETEEEESSRAA